VDKGVARYRLKQERIVLTQLEKVLRNLKINLLLMKKARCKLRAKKRKMAANQKIIKTLRSNIKLKEKYK
jgi:hypothetical protein